MKMIQRLSFLFLLLSFTFQLNAQRSYKELMKDNTVNFYEVCEVADLYFSTIDITKKGTGWKGYQRWKNDNESKYYPSGDRSNVDPYLVRKSYEHLMLNSTIEKSLFPSGWEEVGPARIDSITGHYAAGLGRVECFYVNPTNENQMYMGSRSGGFWRTSDGGSNWVGGSTDFLFASGVNTMTVSPTNADSILINVRNAGNATTHGVYRSINGGDTWTETNYNPVELDKGGLGSNFKINSIAYHPVIPNLVFIAASDGLYRSDDNLETWLKVTTGSISDIEFHPTNSDIIYIYDYYYWGPNKNKVLRSIDNGLTFVGSAEIVGNSDNTSVQLDVSPVCANCIYFASGNGLWKSTDSGLTFDFISNPGEGSQGFAVSSVDTTKMIIGYVDGFRSSNGGASFTKSTWWSLGSSEHGSGVNFQEQFQGSAVYIHADLREGESINGNFYVATDGYFAKSEDNGASWQKLNNEMSIRENYSLGVSQSNHYLTMVGSQDNGTSIKKENGWLEFWGADGMEAIVHPLNDDWMIGSNQFGGRRRTFNGGLSQGGASPDSHSSGWIAPLAYAPNEHMTVYHFGENVHRSIDFGSFYNDIGTPSFSGQIMEAAIAENNSEIIIVTRNEFIERSLDGGISFVDIKGTLPNFTITDIAFDPKDDSTFIVTYNRYQNDGEKIFITRDLGNTWTNITANLNDMPIRGAVIDHSEESYIYLAGEIGVYVKAMDGSDWELYNTDLPNCMIYELEIVNGSNTVRAATWGRGVWEYALKDRVNYPAILKTEISDQPTFDTPKESVEQFVTSTLDYDGTLSEVYLKWSIDSPVFDNTITMENVTGDIWRSESEIPNYPAGTKVYFKVYAVGEVEDTTETYKFMYTVVPFEYCSADGAAGTGSDYIDFVSLEDISNSSVQDYYGDFTDQIATLYLDSTYSLQADLNYAFGLDEMGAWIDFNSNALFEEDEAIDMSDYNVSHESFGTFTVPVDAIIGDTVRMRVRNVYGSEMVPCGDVFGEVEDYSIVIGCINSHYSIDVTTCDAYVSPSGLYTWTTAGVYTDTLESAIGCDSIITVNISVAPTASTINVESCDSYTSPSGLYTWTTAGVYTDTLENVNGCDSIITVNISEAPTASTIDIESCNSYISPSGLYTWTASGTYSDVIENIAGCDSLITVNLTITELDNTVEEGDFELTANSTTGTTYQWVDCNSDWSPIIGEINESFSPIENGSYAVIFTNAEGCIDSSACYDIAGLGLFDVAFGSVQLFPNPTDGNLTITFDSVIPTVTIKVYDLAGKLVFVNAYEEQKQIFTVLNVASGIYYVELDTGDKAKNMIKLVVE